LVTLETDGGRAVTPGEILVTTGIWWNSVEFVGKTDIRIFLTSVFVKKSKRNFDKVNAPTLFYKQIF